MHLMIRVIKGQLSQTLRLVDIHLTRDIIIRVNIFIFPQSIEIKCTPHGIDI